MTFKDLSYKKPKGTVNGSAKKQGSRNTGKNVQRSSERVPETEKNESADTGDG